MRMATTGLSAAQISALRRFDTPTVCNAIEVFDVCPRTAGYMDRQIKANSPDLPPMVGYASTATRRGAVPAREGDAVSTLEEQVSRYGELPGPPVMVYQDLGDPPESATFGDVMCSTFQAFGAVGLITSGAGRDIEQVRALEFPTFSNGSICSHGYNHAVDIYVPVSVGGIVVYPGDLLHGDANGVTTIPAGIAGQVADVCAGIADAEAVVMDYVRAGSPTVKGLAEARAESRSRLKGLRERVAAG
jgi:4-hydroxy-4-methyl-2-oxoglutarate aldolase